MLEHLTDHPRRWRIIATLTAFVVATGLELLTSDRGLWAAMGRGVLLGAVIFFFAPEIRRLAQQRIAARAARNTPG